MQHTDQIQALSEFLLEYATTLMGAGVHTNRAVRNISRIAAFDNGSQTGTERFIDTSDSSAGFGL